MNGRQSYTPQEFLDGLRREEIRPPIAFFGMVKPAEDDDQYLLFAHGYACANWIRIPVSSIDTVDFLDFAPCKDHRHPLVVLHLKYPETDEERFYLSLAQATLRGRPGQAPGRAFGRTRGRPTRLVRGPRSSGARRAFDDPDFPWCSTLPEYEVDQDGTVWCQDWCWESEGQAQYSQC
jgi:hypothetical protein